MNIPRGLGYFLPWTLLLPFAARVAASERTDIRSGLRWGIGVSFVLVSLLPGSLPRYTMPLIAPATWLVALLLKEASVRRAEWARAERLPLAVAVLAAAAIAAYAIFVMPHRQQRAKVRPIAEKLNATLPPGEPLYAVDPEYQPALFYVREPLVYVATARELPRGARWVLVQPERAREVDAHAVESGGRSTVALRLTDYRRKEIILFDVSGPH
jgi:4-amino-4-deoxy-L-arabinose transferase-like glycosyltransferase